MKSPLKITLILLGGYDSHGRWCTSTFHFCIGAFVFRMFGQPDSIAAMEKQYQLRTLDSPAKQ